MKEIRMSVSGIPQQIINYKARVVISNSFATFLIHSSFFIMANKVDDLDSLLMELESTLGKKSAPPPGQRQNQHTSFQAPRASVPTTSGPSMASNQGLVYATASRPSPSAPQSDVDMLLLELEASVGGSSNVSWGRCVLL